MMRLPASHFLTTDRYSVAVCIAVDELRAFVFGLIVAAAIGPIAVLIVYNGVNHGLDAALRSAVGAGFGDFTYSVAALAVGATILHFLEAYTQEFHILSSAILIVLGLWIVWRATHATMMSAGEIVPSGGYGFWATYALTLVNPLTILIFLGFAGQLSLNGRWLFVFYYAGFIFLGSLFVQVALALFGAGLNRWLQNPRAISLLNKVSGLAIAGFGVYGLLWSV